MKTSTVPVICSFTLAAMSAAGLSHWWSLRQFIATLDAGLAVAAAPGAAPRTRPAAKPPQQIPVLLARQTPAPQPVAAQAPAAQAPAPQVATAPAAAPNSAQKAFYEALLAKMDGLQTQNRDLLDQLAETNRDLMKLEFRVDTHSESFRPMPVSEERPFTSVTDDAGVLPPRAEPVEFPPHE